MKMKKLAAIALAGTMVLSSAAVAFAADETTKKGGESGGAGAIEGVVKTDVYTAVLPTESTDAYNYKADPLGLISKTLEAGTAKDDYKGKTFEANATVFFPNAAADKTYDFSSTSDKATIVNKSSKNLKVTITAKATAETDGAALADAKAFETTDTAKKVYLGITDTAGNNEKALAADPGVEMTAVLGAAPEGAYETKYDATASKYTYALKSDVSAFKFAEYSYQINGAANPNAADWAEDTKLPTISVKWDVDLTDDAATVDTPEQTPADAAPSIPTATYAFASGSPLVVAVDLGNGSLAASGVSGITFVNDGETVNVIADRYSYADGKITLAAAFVDNNMSMLATAGETSRTYTVTFNDTAATTATFTVNMPAN